MEVWKDIPGYEKMYQASSLGNIRSIDRIDSNGHSLKSKILKPLKKKKGYLSVMLSKNCITKRYLVHRLVLMAFEGISEQQINHKNCYTNDNRPENLEYVTGSENMKHAVRNGRCDKAIEKAKEMYFKNDKMKKRIKVFGIISNQVL